MKVRIKKTAKILNPEEVELIQEVTEDEHWQDVRERAAIAALGGMLADTNMNAEVDLVAQIAVNYADALVERLK